MNNHQFLEILFQEIVLKQQEVLQSSFFVYTNQTHIGILEIVLIHQNFEDLKKGSLTNVLR